MKTNADNPTSIIPPLNFSDNGYIIAESSSGLANRLRVLAAYLHVAEAKYKGAHLVFIWDKNEACPGHFLSVFEPVPNVIFAKNESRNVLDKHSKINYENSFAVFSWIMKMNDIPRNKFGYPSWSQIEYNMHSRFFPTREIMFKAINFVRGHNICNSSAMHIRETDMAATLAKSSGGRKKSSIQQFIKFVESRPTEEPVFLLTDNPVTQKFFVEKYGSKKILVYDFMESAINQLPLRVANASDIISNRISEISSALSSDHRFTTLENTVLDVIIAAHAKIFKPSGFSSLSELVLMFNRIGKQDRGWCERPGYDGY